MSLGRLLAAGRSLVAGHQSGRYRVNKHIALPKFISPRNPFATANADRATDVPEAGAKAGPVTGESLKDNSSKPNGRKLTAWIGGWGKKLNPFSRLSRTASPTRSAIPRFDTAPVQAELSLDRVKVVRNDLSDADLEVVPVKAPVVPPSKPEEEFAVAGDAWERVSVRMFGPDPS